MRMKLFPRMILAILFVCAACSVLAQTAPAAREGGLPLTVGVGISDFDIDYGNDNGTERRMEGVSAWVDWNFYRAPSLLSGLGIEVEGRDINLGRPASLEAFSSKLRESTALGGVIYTVRHYRNFHPYAKYLMGIGSIDFPSSNPYYTHDTRTVYAPGAGVEYRVYRNVWLRGDYEYQFWPKLFGPNALTPSGFTIGASYDFGHHHGKK
ncbi:MAG: outer membrane beta-barrel protein [Terracidiphilus sp.]|nr:outer membrane beta-barrel protein [Terracidiphilus sp.]MDR3777095.1 outer membrane beta-barrel protein [Terracidiphilus sp.]